MDFVTKDYIGWVIAAASVIGAAVLGWIGYQYKNWRDRRRKLKAAYITVLKKSTDLQPEEVMGELRGSHKGGFRDYCLQRDEIEEIRNRIAEGKDVLVVGDPLAGKSRAVYEALKHTDNPCEVTIPRIVDVDTNELDVRQYISGTRKGILLLDDINKYVGKQHFEHLLQQYIDKGYVIVATCRTGPELAGAKSKLEQIFASLFNDPVELGKVSSEVAQAAAKATDLEMPKQFDGNIGSVFVELETMRQRYDTCSDESRAVLRSIKRLFMAGVYEEGSIFSEAHIKKVCGELEELTLKKFKWQPVLDKLADLSFMRPGKEGIAVEETYIERIFTFESTLLDNFSELATLFSDDPDALHKIGIRANNTEFSDDLGDDFVEVKRLAVEAFKTALSYWSAKTNERQHAMTQNNRGVACRNLGEVEDKAFNCHKAIVAHQESLKVYTLERFPMNYALTQNNLGTAYSDLCEVEDKAPNCRKAIAVYQEALKVYTLERLPKHFAQTQTNLGNAHWSLGGVEDKAGNCKKAIAASLKALKVTTLERFPMDYARTQNNLGAIYQALGTVEDTVGNCKKAIASCLEALKVRTLEHFPMQFAATHNNLGNAYGYLGVVDEGEVNFPSAISSFGKAMKVYTAEKYPFQYASTQLNLGVTFHQLARIEDEAANCQRARGAYDNALSVYRELEMPLQVKDVEHNLAILDAFEAEE